MQNLRGLAILESSGTTYFDSLTEIKIESGKPSGALKIKGDSELHLKRKTRKSLEKAKVVNEVLLQQPIFYGGLAAEIMTFEAIGVSKLWGQHLADKIPGVAKQSGKRSRERLTSGIALKQEVSTTA